MEGYPPPRLVISDQRQRGTLHVRLSGSLDRGTAPLLDAELKRLRREPATTIVLQLGQLRAIDMAGLWSILSAFHGGPWTRTTLVGATGAVRRFFAFGAAALASPDVALTADERLEREAHRQSFVREANERGRAARGPRLLQCECGDPRCGSRLLLSHGEYEDVRRFASRFLVTPNHEDPETARVVADHERYSVIDVVVGAARTIALQRNPRHDWSAAADDEPHHQPSVHSTGGTFMPGTSKPPAPASPNGRVTQTAGGLRIAAGTATVEAHRLLATFTLSEQPEPVWQGAFARAIAGRLSGIAGRWHFAGASIAVTDVLAPRAAAVAAAVQGAVDAANGFVADLADAGTASRAARAAEDERLAGDAATATRAIRDVLADAEGVS